jgi:hypothetical protein
MNAVVGSANHTHLLPEKSFSPSMLLIVSAPRRISSSLMNDGAKVFDVGAFVFESERGRSDVFGLSAATPPREEKDWFRLCEGPWLPANGEDRIMDLGLPLGFPGPGD